MVPILPATPFLYEAAIQLAAIFHLPVIDAFPTTSPFLLYLTEAHLELRDTTTGSSIYVDFLGGTSAYRRRYGGGRKQPLAKAIGLKHGATPTVLDTTAGLGRDAFVLACLGCQVQMIERSPPIAALLYDGLQRAQQDVQIGSLVKERLQLIHNDAQHWLSCFPKIHPPPVIYLDPMYPHRSKSALVKKEMRLFRILVGDDSDASSLLTAALACTHHRIVVKRPKFAPTLNNIPPNFCIKSKKTRFDVYQ